MIICWIVIKLLLLLVANLRVVRDKIFFDILIKYIFINIIVIVINNWFSLSFKLIKTLNITLKKKKTFIYIYLFVFNVNLYIYLQVNFIYLTSLDA